MDDRKEGRRRLPRLDRMLSWLSPRWALRRAVERDMLSHYMRSFSAADHGRRTEGWRSGLGKGPNTDLGKMPLVRERSRDLVRNNCWAASMISEITANLVHFGIIAYFSKGGTGAGIPDIWLDWAETTKCDTLGRKTFYDIQKLVVRTWAEAGECFIRRIWRDNWKKGEIPFSLQVVEPEFIDVTKDSADIRHTKLGIKFDEVGRRVGYWMYKRHPGEAGTNESVLIDAADVIHVYSEDRPGQIRGVPLLSPAIMRLYDLDLFEQAELEKQKIASMYAAFIKRIEGSWGTPSAAADKLDASGKLAIDHLEPGAIQTLEQGEDMVFSSPPPRAGYEDYVKQNLMAVAAGVGLTYEDLSGDYGRVTFLNGRMGKLRFFRKIEQWQYLMLIPQFCDAVARWFFEGAGLVGQSLEGTSIRWQPPIKQMVDPERETKALREGVRMGAVTPFEMIRGFGNDPEPFLNEYAESLKAIRDRQLTFSIDVEKVSDAGQSQQEMRTDGQNDTNADDGDGGQKKSEKK